MPMYFIQNRTNKRLFVPPPVNKTFNPLANASVYIAAAEMEVAAIRNMVSAGLIGISASDNQRLSDDLEVPVLSMIHGGGGVASVSGLTPIASSGGANPVISLSGVVNAAHGGTGLNSPGAVGNVLTSNGAGGWTASAVPPTAPTGPAGGDLTGTYPNPTLVTSGVVAGIYGSGELVPVITVDAKGRVTNASTASNSAAHENYDTLVHDLAESNFQEVSYSSGLVTAITYWTTSAKLLKIRETLFSYTVAQLVSSVVDRQFNGAGAQVTQLLHTYIYNPDETLASITTVRS